MRLTSLLLLATLLVAGGCGGSSASPSSEKSREKAAKHEAGIGEIDDDGKQVVSAEELAEIDAEIAETERSRDHWSGAARYTDAAGHAYEFEYSFVLDREVAVTEVDPDVAALVNALVQFDAPEISLSVRNADPAGRPVPWDPSTELWLVELYSRNRPFCNERSDEVHYVRSNGKVYCTAKVATRSAGSALLEDEISGDDSIALPEGLTMETGSSEGWALADGFDAVKADLAKGPDYSVLALGDASIPSTRTQCEILGLLGDGHWGDFSVIASRPANLQCTRGE